MAPKFAVTYDYLCPFARIANGMLIDELDAGVSFEVTFRPFSLHQNSLPDGAAPVWDDGSPNASGSGVRALLWSLAVRDNHPAEFLRFHRAVFEARHAEGADLSQPGVLEAVAASAGLDEHSIRAEVESGVPMKTLRDEHNSLVEDHGVFGVPTFIAGDEAVFVRFMDGERSEDLRRVVDMLMWTNLNEFKRTRIPR